MNRFITDHKDNWQRLENLLDILETSSLRGLTRMEVREFGELYRRAATDLAIARSETRDPKLINYLNSLVIRAHGKIYRAENQGASLIWDFFRQRLPASLPPDVAIHGICLCSFYVFRYRVVRFVLQRSGFRRSARLIGHSKRGAE